MVAFEINLGYLNYESVNFLTSCATALAGLAVSRMVNNLWERRIIRLVHGGKGSRMADLVPRYGSLACVHRPNLLGLLFLSAYAFAALLEAGTDFGFVPVRTFKPEQIGASTNLNSEDPNTATIWLASTSIKNNPNFIAKGHMCSFITDANDGGVKELFDAATWAQNINGKMPYYFPGQRLESVFNRGVSIDEGYFTSLDFGGDDKAHVIMAKRCSKDYEAVADSHCILGDPVNAPERKITIHNISMYKATNLLDPLLESFGNRAYTPYPACEREVAHTNDWKICATRDQVIIWYYHAHDRLLHVEMTSGSDEAACDFAAAATSWFFHNFDYNNNYMTQADVWQLIATAYGLGTLGMSEYGVQEEGATGTIVNTIGIISSALIAVSLLGGCLSFFSKTTEFMLPKTPSDWYEVARRDIGASNTPCTEFPVKNDLYIGITDRQESQHFGASDKKLLRKRDERPLQGGLI